MALVYIGILVFLFAWGYNQVTTGNKFRDDSQKINIGMSANEVVEIMGQPSFIKQYENGGFEYVYEKSEWKGFFRGGTATRRMEIVFSSEEIAISIGKNENCDKSGW